MDGSTITKAFSLSGVGLHTGADVTIRVLPSAGGIAFHRVRGERLAAHWSNVTHSAFATVLGYGSSRISTVEHLMAAFAFSGITAALVEVDGPEIPAMDGSSAPFIEALKEAGRSPVPAPEPFRVTKPVCVEGVNGAWARLLPASVACGRFELDYPAPIGRQVVESELYTEDAVSTLSSSRTFCRLEDVPALEAASLGLGGSLNNCVVIGPYGPMNEGGYRSPNELARHKLLDAVGDLYLAGGPILGLYEAYKAGHGLNRDLLQAIFSSAPAPAGNG